MGGPLIRCLTAVVVLGLRTYDHLSSLFFQDIQILRKEVNIKAVN